MQTARSYMPGDLREYLRRVMLGSVQRLRPHAGAHKVMRDHKEPVCLSVKNISAPTPLMQTTHSSSAKHRRFTFGTQYTVDLPPDSRVRRLNSDNVLERLADLFVNRTVPDYIRSDNGPEFTAQAVREWLGRIGVKTLFIEPGSPWENGYVESFNGKLRDELLNREIFYTLTEAQILVRRWRRQYNQVRPHSSLGYRPPAPEATLSAPIQ